ncbi:MAG: M16 family metallopeptidase [Acidiferrobacteraceae bacterium]
MPRQEKPHYKRDPADASALRPDLLSHRLKIRRPARFLLVLAALALAACQQTQERTLANGLRVIVRRDTRAPVVVSQLWYKVGSVDEPANETGISHATEHMMFKGTTRYPAGRFARIISENGGSENAFTAQDYTVYYEEIEKSRLPIVFDLEADRMQNLLVPKNQFRKEIRVVMEERRMRTDDNPDAILDERFMRAAFKTSPYGVPVIGWMHNIRKLTARKVRAWYHRWYAPNNAVLVVVGDVRPEHVFALARKYFGHIPRKAIPARNVAQEPPQKHERRVQVRIPAQVPYLIMGYHVPVITRSGGWQPYALDVLSGVLSGGPSARLPADLVRRRQIAASVDSNYTDVARYPELFTISAIPAQGHSLSEVEHAILAEIARLRQTPVSRRELDRVKAEVVAADVYSRDSMFGQAMLLGMFETVGLRWQLVRHYFSNIEAVTAEQVLRVARTYLRRSNLTVAELHPLPMRVAPVQALRTPENAHVR